LVKPPAASITRHYDAVELSFTPSLNDQVASDVAAQDKVTTVGSNHVTHYLTAKNNSAFNPEWSPELAMRVHYVRLLSRRSAIDPVP
jgi:hypothetical protein